MYRIPTLSTKVLFLVLVCMYVNALHAGSELHEPLTKVLSESVVNGHVNYKAIKNNPEFTNYLETLKNETKFDNKNEKLAYWINAYNALVIQGILRGGSPGSFFSRMSFFKDDKYEVNGRKITLYDIEHKIIRPLEEPRIHFAINCASASCPKLQSEAYTAEKLNEQLDQVTSAFINDPSNNHFNENTTKASVSKIFDWFQEDFEKHSGSVQQYIAQYINDEKIAKELRENKYKIKHLKYDWSLNGTKS